jgi:ABC-2 type transport system ATP-binding protein
MLAAMPDVSIRAEGLVKHFGSVHALDGVDLEVATGTVLGLLGPNGAGKTTCVRILTTLLRPDAGRAEVAGVDVAHDPDGVRRRIGLAGQYAAVDENLTGLENLFMVGRLNHLPKDVSRRRAAELLARFDLADAGDRTVKTYSGGMRRRLDLAAALVNTPPVLFLDEPTTGLDPRSRTSLWGVIDDLVAEGTTLLLTTQYLEEADRLADRIAVVDHGRVIAEGTATELKADYGSTVVEIEIARLRDAGKARRALAAVGHVRDGNDRRKVRVTLEEGARGLVEVVRALDGADVQVTDLDVHEPSLDDVFLSLTGRTATDEEETEPEAKAS